MKILVTGAAGTLGRPLCAELRRRGHIVHGCDLMHTSDPEVNRADISDYRQALDAVGDGFYDYIYHLAAEFGRNNGENFYEQVWKTNVIGTRNILEIAARQGIRVIFASSSEIYGEMKRLPSGVSLREDLADAMPLRQINDYAISKWVNEQQIMNFEEQRGLEAVRLRFFNAYGPGERYHPFRSVIALFCHAALNDEPYTVYEDYHRVFMFIDDFIPTLANVCENFKSGEVYNIGGNEYRSVKDASDIILDMLGKDDSLVTYLPQDEHNVVNKRPDISKAVRDLGHDPRITLEEGLPKTLAWMESEIWIGAA